MADDADTVVVGDGVVDISAMFDVLFGLRTSLSFSPLRFQD